MIKKIKIELTLIALLIINIFVSSNIDIKFNQFISIYINSYLKDFFTKITVLGDSIWIFLITFLVYFFSLFMRKILPENNYISYDDLKIKSFFLFTATLITGLITQIIKHIIGRPRPNYLIEQNFYDFNFFKLESSFHSFPSGHSSTIFVLALVLSIFTPKIKYFYISFAIVVAFSRVVVNAHFLTDILGGFVIALIGIKLTHFFFKKIKEIKKITFLNENHIGLTLIVFIIMIIFLTIGNSFDIYVSNIFYEGDQTFFLQRSDIVTFIIRKILLNLILIYIFILPFLSLHIPISKLFFNHKFNIKDVFFIFISGLFNLVLVVNLILKNLWGRARPNDIINFDGKDVFTPWYKFSEACSTNCSFVSGDASVGFSLIVFFILTKNIKYFWLSLIFGGIIGLTRIAEGGHFLSDVLLAGFIILVLNYLIFTIYKNKK